VLRYAGMQKAQFVQSARLDEKREIASPENRLAMTGFERPR